MIIDKNIGFIGIGNLGNNLAYSILQADFNVFIHDIDKTKTDSLIKKGAYWCDSIEKLVTKTSLIITCLPNPKIVSDVLEKKNGILDFINSKHLLVECSTTDEEEILRLANLIESKGSEYLNAPLSGGEHRSVTGNISVLSSGKRKNFERAFPILREIGYEIIYLGDKLGNASTVKVLTNYLASINLVSIGEVFMICKKYGIDLNLVYHAIKISSGNSFVHTTEGQLILSGSMDAQFTMDLVCKDLRLVNKLQKKLQVPSDLIPLIFNLFNEGKKTLGHKAFSTEIVKLLEKKCNTKLREKNFPNQLIDTEPRKKGIEIKV